MKKKIPEHYLRLFDGTPVQVIAPGRINIIGEHTDYNEGFVLPAAIDKCLHFALANSSEANQSILHAAGYGETARFSPKTPQDELPLWARYIRGIMAELTERGYAPRPVQGVFGGDIPIGAGLSSSAALCCGFVSGIAALQQLKITRAEMALISQAAEHRTGLNCGLMDQYAVLFGKKEQGLFLDCRTLNFRYVPLHLPGHSWVLINSNVKHQLAAAPEYNDRRQSCENAVAAVRQNEAAVQSLRDVTPAALEAVRRKISPEDYRRASFVLEENERVGQMAEALTTGDFARVGQLLLQSHEGLRQLYEVTVPETDLLVDLARKEPAIAGARQMGGGFGGCTLNLVKDEEVAACMARLLPAYREKTGIAAEFYIVKIADGVRLVRPA
ncbi:MAG: galactokinase [Saprospiraceae bacterium]